MAGLCSYTPALPFLLKSKKFSSVPNSLSAFHLPMLFHIRWLWDTLRLPG